MAELFNPANIAIGFQQGQMLGTQQRRERESEQKQSRLAALAQQAYADPSQRQGLIGQAVGIDPQAGFALDQQFRTSDDAREKTLLSTARLIDSAPPEMKEAIYQRVRPQLEAHLPGLPPAYSDQVGQGVKAFIASRSGGAPALHERYRVVGGALVDLQNPTEAVYTAPDRPQNATFQVDANGVGWWLAPGQPPQRADMPGQGPQGQPPQGQAPGGANGGGISGAGAAMFEDALQNVLSREGGFVANDAGAGPTNFGINSRANPDVNVATLDKAGAARIYRERYWDAIGADNLPPSIREAAFDTAVNQGPEVAKRLIAQSGGDPQAFAVLRQRHYDGLVAANPQKYGQYADGWRRRNQETAAGTGGGLNFAKPPAADKPSALMEKLELAQRMGATPEQLKQMVFGETGGGKPSATQLKLANAAKAKLIDLKAIEDQLARVEQTFGPLQDSFSAGPYIGGMIPSEEGKRFDGAVSLLQGMVRKLTRTPGEGAMSDYETKLAQLANPSRSEYESVTADQIQQLRALIQTTRHGYEALLQDAGGNTANLPGQQAPASNATAAPASPQPGEVQDGYRFRGGNPADPSSWERL